MFLAGPAFQSGRYGMSCGAMCKYISESRHVPAVTCMHEENPDHMPSGTASIWRTYPVGELDALLPGEFFSVHGGYSTNDVNADPEVLVSLSTIKELEKEGKFGSLYPYLFTTTGNLTALKEAHRMGEEIAREVKAGDVDAVIFVST